MFWFFEKKQIARAIINFINNNFCFFIRRILGIKSADEFYCKMGTLSGELLNGHLFDSNGLIQRIVDLGPIADLQKMREKHLFNVTPWKDRKGLR